MFLLIEFCLTAIGVAVAFVSPNLGASWFEKVERLFARLARRRGLSVLVVGLAALAVRTAVLPILPVPQPGIHDEFSYLLAADTFAHGRVTNPTHPMWVHFETFHVLQQPTYTSKFPPAQGLFLALGQVIFGHPFWGVWLSVGLMCAAICWMLQAWLPPLWALLGGLLVVIRLGTFSYWVNSYWGGAVAAIGGALVLGALSRIQRQQRVRDALLMGLGLAILANSRPYEGLILSLPVGLALIVWIWRNERPTVGRSMTRIVLPLGLVLALSGGMMLDYFWRTTGSPFRTPYLIYEQAYNPVPLFPWQSLKPLPEYHHATVRNFYLAWPLAQYEFARSHPGVLPLENGVWLGFFFFGPALGLPVFMLALILPYGMSYKDVSRKTRFLFLVTCVSLLALLPVYFEPHYAAPLTAVIYALVLLAMQRVRRWRWRGRPTGLALVRAVPLVCAAMLLVRAAAPSLPIAPPGPLPYSWCSQDTGIPGRAEIMSKLERFPGRHLVIARYKPSHDLNQEWVYNAADIDNAKVVWARDMDPIENQELINYFRDRHVWLMEADENPPRLLPYPAVLSGTAASTRSNLATK